MRNAYIKIRSTPSRTQAPLSLTLVVSYTFKSKFYFIFFLLLNVLFSCRDHGHMVRWTYMERRTEILLRHPTQCIHHCSWSLWKAFCLVWRRLYEWTMSIEGFCPLADTTYSTQNVNKANVIKTHRTSVSTRDLISHVSSYLWSHNDTGQLCRNILSIITLVLNFNIIKWWNILFNHECALATNMVCISL